MCVTKKAAVLAMVLVAAPAAEPGAPAPPAGKDTSAELITRTRHAKKLFDSLTGRMRKLADLLDKSDPDSARALRSAVNQAQRAMIADDMASVVRRLREGLANPALRKQQEVVADLKKVLDALRRTELKLDQRRKMLLDLEEFLARVNRLIQRQRKLEEDSRCRAGATAMDRRMQGLLGRLDEIIAVQRKLLAETIAAGEGDPAIRRLAALRDRVRGAIRDQERIGREVRTAPVQRLPVAGLIQDRLSRRTGKLARDLAAAAGAKPLARAMAETGADPEALDTAAGQVGAAAKEMTLAGQALRKSEPARARLPHRQALAELRSAEKALTNAIDKMLKGARSGELAGKQRQIEQKTEALADAVDEAAAEAGVKPDAAAGGQGRNLRRAAKQMDHAAQKLAGQNVDDAVGHQKRALDELEGRKYTLAQLHRRMKEKAARPLERQKNEQDRLGDETRRLGKQMAKAGEERADGDKSVAGRKSVSKAAAAMGEASGKLARGEPAQANRHQNDALDQLRKARRRLEEQIAAEQQRLREEELARIDQMLERILKAQRNISDQTRRVAGKLAGRDKAGAAGRRAAELKAAELSNGEARLAEDAERIIKILRAEGSTFVFPSVLAEVRKDLSAVADRLAAKRCGPLTQGLQRQIERSLEAMIDSIRKELAERKGKGGGGAGRGGGGGKAPLVPGVAELKMLRALQLQVNARTKVLDREEALAALPAEQIRDEYKALADREQKIRALTRKLAEKIYGKNRTARKVE